MENIEEKIDKLRDRINDIERLKNRSARLYNAYVEKLSKMYKTLEKYKAKE